MRLFLTAAALFTAMQIAPLDTRSNPYTNPRHTLEARLDVPAPISAMLKNSCANCHSNETRWPWYSSVAPASWAIAHDVNRGRAAMNFSDWTDRPGRARGLLTAACVGVQSRRMPPANYRLLHPDSALTEEQAAEFCSWAASQSQALRQRPPERQ